MLLSTVFALAATDFDCDYVSDGVKSAQKMRFCGYICLWNAIFGQPGFLLWREMRYTPRSSVTSATFRGFLSRFALQIPLDLWLVGIGARYITVICLGCSFVGR